MTNFTFVSKCMLLIKHLIATPWNPLFYPPPNLYWGGMWVVNTITTLAHLFANKGSMGPHNHSWCLYTPWHPSLGLLPPHCASHVTNSIQNTYLLLTHVTLTCESGLYWGGQLPKKMKFYVLSPLRSWQKNLQGRNLAIIYYMLVKWAPPKSWVFF